MLRGKSLGMSLRSTQVARLRYSLVAVAEKYTICLVSRVVDGILIRKRAAPMIGMLVPLAEYIVRFTGMRSVAVSCRLARRVGPVRQLWPWRWSRDCMSLRVRCVRVYGSPPLLLIWRHSGSVVGGIDVGSMTGMFGPMFGDADIVSTCSNTALSCSMLCQHMWAEWFGFPHVEQVVPKAGQCSLLWAVLSCSPCPVVPQKVHMPLLVGVALEVWLPWPWPWVEVALWLGWLCILGWVWFVGVARGRVGVVLACPCPACAVGRRCRRL